MATVVNNPLREVVISAVEPVGAIVHDGLAWYDSTNHVWFLRANGTWREMTMNDALAGTVNRSITIDGGTY